MVIGRAQLADPEFCNKCREGRLEDIDYCVGCNQGCYDGFADPSVPHITCLRNPALGRERECALHPTAHPRTVLIAGGGVAGMEAAITLKQLGHHPILCEATGELGGQFLLAGKAPRKQEMETAARAMGEKARRLGVEIRLNTPVTPELIEAIKPDAVFNCIGAEPLVPDIPGSDLPCVADSHDVLGGRVQPAGNVVVVGGGLVGMETAEYLAQRGCKVTDLEMGPEYCADMGIPRKICVTESIHASGINPVTKVRVTAIEPGRVLGESEGKPVEFACDWAVIAIGARSRNGQELEQASARVGAQYRVLGDAFKARRALNATREAFDAALALDKED